jgi:hypothetical protein
MKRMIFGALVGLGAGYLLWTPRGRQLVDRAMSRRTDEFLDVTVVGTVPVEPTPSAESPRRASMS